MCDYSILPSAQVSGDGMAYMTSLTLLAMIWNLWRQSSTLTFSCHIPCRGPYISRLIEIGILSSEVRDPIEYMKIAKRVQTSERYHLRSLCAAWRYIRSYRHVCWEFSTGCSEGHPNEHIKDFWWRLTSLTRIPTRILLHGSHPNHAQVIEVCRDITCPRSHLCRLWKSVSHRENEWNPISARQSRSEPVLHENSFWLLSEWHHENTDSRFSMDNVDPVWG